MYVSHVAIYRPKTKIAQIAILPCYYKLHLLSICSKYFVAVTFYKAVPCSNRECHIIACNFDFFLSVLPLLCSVCFCLPVIFCMNETDWLIVWLTDTPVDTTRQRYMTSINLSDNKCVTLLPTPKPTMLPNMMSISNEPTLYSGSRNIAKFRCGYQWWI